MGPAAFGCDPPSRPDIVHSEKFLALQHILQSLMHVIFVIRDNPNIHDKYWATMSIIKSDISKRLELYWNEKQKTKDIEHFVTHFAEIVESVDRKQLKKMAWSSLLGAGTFGTVLSASSPQNCCVAVKFIMFQANSLFNAQHEYEMQKTASLFGTPLAFPCYALLNPSATTTPRHSKYWARCAATLHMGLTHKQICKALHDLCSVIVMDRVDGTMDKMLLQTVTTGLGGCLVRTLQSALKHLFVHGDLKMNNIGYREGREKALDVRFIDFGKSFCMDTLHGIGIGHDKAATMCQQGHLYDISSLLESFLKAAAKGTAGSDGCCEIGELIMGYYVHAHTRIRRSPPQWYSDSVGRSGIGMAMKSAESTRDTLRCHRRWPLNSAFPGLQPALEEERKSFHKNVTRIIVTHVRIKTSQ